MTVLMQMMRQPGRGGVSVASVPTSFLVTATTLSPGTGSVVPVTAQLRDQFANPLALAGRTGTWTKTGGGTLSLSSGITDANGRATVNLTAGAVGDPETVTFTDTNGITGTTPIITPIETSDLAALAARLVGGQIELWAFLDPAARPSSNAADINFDQPTIGDPYLVADAAILGYTVISGTQVDLVLSDSTVIPTPSGDPPAPNFLRILDPWYIERYDATVGTSGADVSIPGALAHDIILDIALSLGPGPVITGAVTTP